MALHLALPSSSSADIFRCQRASGEVVFQATRCPEADGHRLSLRPLNVLGEPLRPGERALLVKQTRRKRGQARTKSRKNVDVTQRRLAERCLAKRQRLAAVGAKLRRGYKPAQGERLRRKRNEYAEYVRQFCD
jgi:hypothetical protein